MKRSPTGRQSQRPQAAVAHLERYPKMAYSPRKLEFLERECLKEANRAMRSGKMSKEAFLKLRIQTYSPLERLVVLVGAIIAGGFAAWLFLVKDSAIVAAIFVVLSLFLLLIAAFGRHSTVVSVLHAIDTRITMQILDAIF